MAPVLVTAVMVPRPESEIFPLITSRQFKLPPLRPVKVRVVVPLVPALVIGPPIVNMAPRVPVWLLMV